LRLHFIYTLTGDISQKFPQTFMHEEMLVGVLGNNSLMPNPVQPSLKMRFLSFQIDAAILKMILISDTSQLNGMVNSG